MATTAALSATAAPARDLNDPRGLPRSAPVHRPTGCESFGTDFHKVEGTDTCVRISGSVRMETSVSTAGASFWPRR